MTEEVLRQLIAGGETATVEFKIKAPRPAELAERLCGMANSRTGGVIIFGVADTGNVVVGLKEPQATIDGALRAARTVKPPVALVGSGPTTHVLDGVTLVVAEIPPNTGTLYQSSGVFWVRKGSHTVPMAADEVSDHLYSSGVFAGSAACIRGRPSTTSIAIGSSSISRCVRGAVSTCAIRRGKSC